MTSKTNFLVNYIEKKNNIIIGLGTNLAGNMIMFLTTIYITNHVSEAIYGEFRLSFALVSIMVVVLMLGRDSSILYYYQKEQHDRVLFEETCSGIVLIVVGCAIFYYFDDFFIRTLLNNNVSKSNYHLSLLMVPLWAIYNLLTPIIRVKGYINSGFILSNLLQRILRFPFLLLFILAGYNGFSGLAWSMILSQVLLLALLCYSLAKTVQWTTPDIASFFKRFNYALSLGMNAIMLSIAGKIDVILLGSLSTTNNVAIYDIVTSLAIVCLFPYIALSKSFEPRLYHYFHHEEKHDAYRRNFSLSFTLTTTAGVFFILFSREILSLFGTEYVAGATAFTLLSIVYVGISCWGAVSEWMTMNGFAKFNFLLLIISGLLNIGLCYALIPKYGLLGATIALGVSLTLSKVLAFLFIMLKEKAYKLIVFPGEFLLMVAIIALSVYFDTYNIMMKVALFIIMSFLLFIAQKPLRLRLINIIKRKAD